MSVRRLFETACWWAFGATLLGTAAFAPMGCAEPDVPPSAVARPLAAELEEAARLPVVALRAAGDEPSVQQAPEREAATAASAPRVERTPHFTSLTTRADVTDLVVIGEHLFASSTGGVDAWTLGGERVASWGAEDGLPGNAIVDLHVSSGSSGDAPPGPAATLVAAGPGGVASLDVSKLDASALDLSALDLSALDLSVLSDPSTESPPVFTASLRADGAALVHRLSAAPGERPLTTAVLSTEGGRAVGTFSGTVHLEGDLGSGVRMLPGVVLHLQTLAPPSPGLRSQTQVVAVSTQGVYALGAERGVTLLEEGDLSSAARSGAGGLLLGFRDGRIVERTSAGKRHRRRRAHGAAVTALLEHRAALYFAVEGQGVRKASRRGLVRFKPRVDTCFNHVGALALWRGRVMLGGFDGGLCEMGNNGPRRRWRAPSPLPSDLILSLGSSGDTLWVGTSFGVARLDPRKRRSPRVRAFAPSFKNRYALSAYGIVAIARGAEHLWIADGRGVSEIRVDDERDVVRHRALPGLPEGLTDLTVAGEHVWVATEHDGVSQRTTEGWRLHGPADGLAEAWVTKVVAAPDGRAWTGHSMRGVSFHDGERWQIIDEGHGLPDGAIVSLVYDDASDVVWAGTLGGLAAIDGARGEVIGSWDSRDGLPDPRVHALLLDGDGLWAATEGGLAKLADRHALLEEARAARRGASRSPRG